MFLFCRIKPRYTRVVYCACFCHFLANQRSSIAPSYAPIRMPTCGETSSTLDFPRHATPAAHVPAYCAAAARSSSCVVRVIKPSSISDAADALPSVAMVQIGIHTSYLCISAEVCRQIRVLLLVWRRVRCAGWRGSPLTSAFSYGGQSGTMEGLPIAKNRQKNN